MIRRKRLIRNRQHDGNVPFPLPNGWKEVRKIGSVKRRWNTETGKFDLPA